MRSLAALFIAGLLSSAPLAAVAHDYAHRGIDNRLYQHRPGIVIIWRHGDFGHGHRRGLRLLHRDARIARIEHHYRDDGVLTRVERRHRHGSHRHGLHNHGGRSIYRHRDDD